MQLFYHEDAYIHDLFLQDAVSRYRFHLISIPIILKTEHIKNQKTSIVINLATGILE